MIPLRQHLTEIVPEMRKQIWYKADRRSLCGVALIFLEGK